jgi:ribosomal protein S18 acetylase RimI-like enzyme
VAGDAVPGGDRVLIRNAEPSDYPRVISVIDEWWGGRPMAAMLPKLFFIHFRDTSFVAEDDGELAGFLCGFRSQTHDDEAYIHFVGIDPAHRGGGLARTLYERFFAAVEPRTTVRAVTSPRNEGSLAFHRAVGFEVERIDEDYDGRGESRALLLFAKSR